MPPKEPQIPAKDNVYRGFEERRQGQLREAGERREQEERAARLARRREHLADILAYLSAWQDEALKKMKEPGMIKVLEPIFVQVEQFLFTPLSPILGNALTDEALQAFFENYDRLLPTLQKEIPELGDPEKNQQP